MANFKQVLKVAKPFAVIFASAMGCGFLSSLMDDDKIAKSLGIAKETLKQFLNAVGISVGGTLQEMTEKLGESFSYGVNQNLQSSIQTAYKEALEKIRNDFIIQYEISENQQIDHLNFFIEDLLRVLSNDEIVEDLVKNNSQLHADQFLQVIFNTQSISYPQNIGVSKETIKQFFVDNFKANFTHFFLEELKTDEKAKTAYFKHLLEGVISNTTDLKKDFSVLYDFSVQLKVDLKEWAEEQKRRDESIINSFSKLDSLLQNHFSKLEQQQKDIENLILEQLEPHLDMNIEAAENRTFSNNFDYKQQFTSFIGRNEELFQLWNFLKCNKKFAWWIVTGPGGMGKSRLAQEFCTMSRSNGYHAGFYDLKSGSSITSTYVWSKWKFRNPTLLVIDYALFKAKDVKDLIITLHKKLNNSNASTPVRLLLIHRSISEEWKDFMKLTEVQNSKFINSFELDELKLTELGDDFLWKIIKQICLGAGKSIDNNKKKDILNKLEELDKQKRPLFAFFTGVALADGKNIRHWNVHELLAYHLVRLEENIWKQVPGYIENAVNLKTILLINSLTTGLNIDELRIIGTKLNIDIIGLKHVYNKISDFTQISRDGKKKTVWNGLLPNILGEHFILSMLNDFLSNDEDLDDGKKIAVDTLRTAWEIKPESVAAMSWLSYWDFYNEFSLSSALLHDTELLNQLPSEAGSFMSMFLYNLIALSSMDSDLDKAIKIYRQLKELAQKRDEKQIWMYTASAANTFISYFVKEERCQAEALEMYEELKALSNGSENTEMWKFVAVAVYNLVNSFGKIESRQNEAIQLYEELKLYADRKSKTEIWKWRASTARTLIGGLSEEESRRNTAIKIYEELREFAENRKETEIWRDYAEAGCFIILAFCQDLSRWDNAISILDKLETFAQQRNDMKIWEHLTISANLLIVKFSVEENYRQKSVGIYDNIKAIAEKIRDIKIWRIQATATGDLIAGFSPVESRRDEAVHVYNNLKMLAIEKDDLKIWIDYARATYNLISGLSEQSSRRDQAIEILNDFKFFVRERKEPEIWITLALINLL